MLLAALMVNSSAHLYSKLNDGETKDTHFVSQINVYPFSECTLFFNK